MPHRDSFTAPSPDSILRASHQIEARRDCQPGLSPKYVDGRAADFKSRIVSKMLTRATEPLFSAFSGLACWPMVNEWSVRLPVCLWPLTCQFRKFSAEAAMWPPRGTASLLTILGSRTEMGIPRTQGQSDALMVDGVWGKMGLGRINSPHRSGRGVRSSQYARVAGWHLRLLWLLADCRVSELDASAQLLHTPAPICATVPLQ